MLLRRLAGALERRTFPFRSRGRHRAIGVERVAGVDLFLLPSVLNPALFRTGPLLAEAVVEALSAPGDRVLDMGCGAGLVAIRAAREGALATAIDLNPEAVRATRINAMLNRVRISALTGDLFEPLAPGAAFELIAFNPPFFQGPPDAGDPLSWAFQGGPGLSVLDRFLGRARAHLAPAGAILIAGSTEGALARMRELYAAHGFGRVTTVRKRERVAERLLIDRLDAAAPGELTREP